jgi:hypothetical protein
MKVENDIKIWQSDQLYYELTSKMCQAYRGQAGIEMDGTKGVIKQGGYTTFRRKPTHNLYKCQILNGDFV